MAAGGALRAIVEEREASARQRRIREINTGVLLAPGGLLRDCLPRLQPREPHGEFYLTDLIGWRYGSPAHRHRGGGGRQRRCWASTTSCSSRPRNPSTAAGARTL